MGVLGKVAAAKAVKGRRDDKKDKKEEAEKTEEKKWSDWIEPGSIPNQLFSFNSEAIQTGQQTNSVSLL